MIVFEDLGLALTHQKIVPGNTVTGLSAYCYKYKVYRLNFDDADSEIAAGDWLVEAGTGARAVAKALYVTSTAWTNGVGYALIDSWNGTAWTNDAEIKVAAGATMANVNQAAAIVEATDAEYILAGRFEYKGLTAKSALVVCYANTALLGINGGKPDQTALIGTPMVANSSIMLKTADHMANFKCIDYTSGSASIIQVDFFF